MIKMEQYKTLSPLTFASGLIGLNDDQATLRSGCLEAKTKGVYLIKLPVQFKAGEIIGLDDLPKAYIDSLEVVKKKAAK